MPAKRHVALTFHIGYPDLRKNDEKEQVMGPRIVFLLCALRRSQEVEGHVGCAIPIVLCADRVLFMTMHR